MTVILEQYSLFCMDCIDYTPTDNISLIITDAPHFNTLSTEEVIKRLEKFYPETYVICKDERVVLNSPTKLIQRDHRAFSGNLFEKIKFVGFYIQRYTEPGDLVFDPFCGYSSTGVAAVALKRRYIGIDNKQDAIEESERILSKVVP